MRGSVRKLRSSVGKLGGTVSQLAGTVFQIFGTVIKLSGTVRQVGSTVLQIAAAVHQLIGRILKIGQFILKVVQILDIVQAEFAEDSGSSYRHTVLHLKGVGIQSHFDVSGKIDIFQILVIFQFQAFVQPRETISDDNAAAAVRYDLTVGDLDVADRIRIEDHSGQHGERRIGFLVFGTFHLLGDFIIVLIVYADGDRAAFSGKLVRRNIFPIQLIAVGDADRQFFIADTLIINVRAVCLPGQFVAVLGILLVSLNILNVG